MHVMKTLLSAVFVPLVFLILAPFSLKAGVILTNTGQAETGTLIETGDVLTLQSPFGSVTFKKETVAWYSLDNDVNTLLKGAQKARSDDNTAAAMKLFEQSATREPATQSQANQELQSLRDKAIAVATTASEPRGDPYANYSPEEKIARGKQMIENGNAQLQAIQNAAKNKISRPDYIPLEGHSHNFIPMGASPKGTIGMDSSQLSSPALSEDEKARNNANDLVNEGNALVKRGESEIAQRPPVQDAAKNQQDIQNLVIEAKKARGTLASLQGWTQEEKLVNGGAAALCCLIILAILWHITMKEH